MGELKNKHVACVPSKDDNTKSHIRFQLTDGRYADGTFSAAISLDVIFGMPNHAFCHNVGLRFM